MARPNNTDEALLIGILEKYYAEVACGNAGGIKFTELEKYARTQGVPAKEYEFRRNKTVRQRLEEWRSLARKEDAEICTLVYKSLDIDGLVKTCRDISDLKKKLADIDMYWKSVYDRCAKLEEAYRAIIAQKADCEKQMGSLRQDVRRMEALYQASEKENKNLRRENSYLRKMLEKYLYPELARQLMREAHLPAGTVQNVTREALDEMIEGRRPAAFGGVQKEKDKPKSREEQLFDEMKRQAEE